jgi:EmrB/QacA subfamily drug resistance transporter
MSAVDSTVVLLALFPIASDLHSDFVTMIWVIIAYLLVNTALVLSFGRLSDMYGRKTMYNVGFVIFTIGSALCGFAPSGLTLVAFRVLQGTGAAFLTSNAYAILSEAFPRQETGRAYGLLSIVWGIGSVLGIVLGGIIITYTTWRLIFLINVPIGIFATIWAYKELRKINPQGQRGSFDLPAALSFTAGLLSLLFGITWGLLYSWGNVLTISSLVLSPFIFGIFVAWEAKFSKDPILNFDFFKDKNFSFSLIAAVLQFLGQFSVNFLLIFYLEGIYGLSALEASYLIIPYAAAAAAIGPVGGFFSDKFGFKKISLVGLVLAAFALILFSQLTPNTTLLEISLIELLSGVGLAFFWPSNTSAIMAATPPAKYGVGSGIMNTFRNTGMILSFAVSLTAATSVIPSSIAYQLFIGTLSSKLKPALASAYLSGESFAFEISAVLVIIAIIFVAMTKVRMIEKVSSHVTIVSDDNVQQNNATPA